VTAELSGGRRLNWKALMVAPPVVLVASTHQLSGVKVGKA
jgi:hypothetical protein